MAKQSIPKLKRTCQVEGCNNIHDSKGYCGKHSMQIRRHGKILEPIGFIPNKVIPLKNARLIILTNNDSSKISVVIVDNEDLDKVKKYRWCVKKSSNIAYAHTPIRNKKGIRTTISMHRLIMNAKKGQIIDHRNRNGLDNRKENLRFCTSQQNRWNSKAQKGTSIYKGVCWNQQDKKWNVKFGINDERKFLGVFDNETDAALAYDEAAKKHHGEFARLNFPQGETK